MRIAMIGSGYAWLILGACFAHFGQEVVCIDKDPAKIENLKAVIVPVYEAMQLRLTNDLPSGITGELVDLRYICQPAEVRAHDFTYFCAGPA